MTKFNIMNLAGMNASREKNINFLYWLSDDGDAAVDGHS